MKRKQGKAKPPAPLFNLPDLCYKTAHEHGKIVEKDYVTRRSLREIRRLRIPSNINTRKIMWTFSYVMDSMELLRKFRMSLKPQVYLVSPRLFILTSLKGRYEFLKFIFGKAVKWIYRYRNHTVKRSIYEMLSDSGRPKGAVES